MGAYLLESGALGSTGRRGGSDVGGRGPTPLGEVGYSGGKRRMATTPRAGPSLTGHSLPAGPNEARPRAARAGWRDAPPAETRRRGVRRTGRIRTELYSNLQAFSATLES